MKSLNLKNNLSSLQVYYSHEDAFIPSFPPVAFDNSRMRLLFAILFNFRYVLIFLNFASPFEITCADCNLKLSLS